MVGKGGSDVQQCSSAGKTPRLDNRIGYFVSGLGGRGGNSEGSTGQQVRMGELWSVEEHQLLGADSSFFSSEILCEGQEELQHFNKNRKHNSESIHQSFWWDPLPSNECSSNRDGNGA